MAKQRTWLRPFSSASTPTPIERMKAEAARANSASRGEAALLCACLRQTWSCTTRGAVEALSSASWMNLVTHAQQHGAAPLLHHRLRSVKDLHVDTEAARRLRDAHAYNQLRSLTQFERIGTLLASAATVDIDMILLKGAHLARWVYDEPALRPMLDVDVLVRRDDAERARELLLESGYRDAPGCDAVDYSRLHHLHPLARLGEVRVEVHHHLVPDDAPFVIDLDGLWARSKRGNWSGTDLQVLAPEDLLMHLCTHASYNDRFRVGLLTLCDIEATVRRHDHALDWTQLVDEANGDGRARFVYASLRLARSLLDAAVPDDVLHSMRHGPEDDRVVDAAREYIFDPDDEVPSTVQSLDGVAGTGPRLRVIARGAFPPPKKMRVIYALRPGDWRAYAFYLLRPFDLLWRRGRALLAIVLRLPAARSALAREDRRRMLRRWAQAREGGAPSVDHRAQ